MAETDGSIVLSVKINTSEIQPQLSSLKKQIENMAKTTDRLAKSVTSVNKELTKQELLNEKVKQAQEKTQQAVEKTNQAVEKTNQAKLKTQQLDDKTILSAEKVTQAELKTAQAQEKLNQEKAKTGQQTAKQTQEEAKVYNEIFKAVAAREKVNQAAERTFQEIEKTKQAEEGTRQSFEKTAQAQQKTNQEVEKSNQAVEKTKQAIEKTTQAVEKTKQAYEKTKQAITNAQNAQEKLRTGADKVASTLQRLCSSLGIYLGLRQLARFSNEASKLAAETESYLMRINTLYGEAGQKVYDFVNKNASALGMAKTTAYEAATSFGNLFATFTDSAENAELTNRMLQATAVIASQTGRTFDDVFEKIRSGLYGNIRAIDDLGISVRKSTIANSESFQEVSNGVLKYNDLTDAQLQQIRALEILRQAHELYGDEVINSAALARSQFQAAVTDFQASWGRVINTVLVPVLRILTTIFNYATKVLDAISGFSGKKRPTFSGVGTSNVGVSADTNSGGSGSGSNSSASKKSPEEKEIEKQINAIKKKNKELQKQRKTQQQITKEQKLQLASFDELEILESNKNDETLEALDAEIEKNNEIIDQLQEKLELLREARQASAGSGSGSGGGLVSGGGGGISDSSYGDIGIGDTGEVTAQLALLTNLTGMALAGLGILLICTGHWMLGVPMVVAGWTLTAASLMMAKDLDKGTQEQLAKLTGIAGAAAVGLGIILLCTGKWAIGLTLVTTGAAYLGTAYALTTDGMKTKIQEKATELFPLLKGIAEVAFCVGCILLFTSKPLVGLGLILVAAETILTASYLTTGDFKSALETAATTFAPILKGVGILMCIVGMVLLFTNQFFKGLGMILFGIGAYFTGTALEEGALTFDNIKQKLQDTAVKLAPKLKALGVVMFIIGIVLIFTMHFLKGIAMLIVGAAAYCEAVNIENGNLSPTDILDAIKTAIDSVGKGLRDAGAAAFIIGLVLCFVSGGTLAPYGIKMMIGGAASWAAAMGLGKGSFDTTDLETELGNALDSVYKFISPKVDKIKNKLHEISEALKEWATGKNKYGIPTDTTIKAAPELGFIQKPIQVPALARGAVLPGNKPFMAIVNEQTDGVNVEAPAKLIKQMAMEAIVEANMDNSQQVQQPIREEHYYLDNTELMSIVYKLFKGGERLQGTSLVQGGDII